MISPEPSAPVIEVKGLVTHYGTRKILRGIDLNIEAGEILVIMGGSGSGKSTFLRHLLGLEVKTSGSIKVLDREVGKLGLRDLLKLRRHMGVAFQGGALISSLTVLENIMLPLAEHTRLDRATMEIMARMKLEVVDLAGFGDLMPSELSGGMLKRAAFARAIVMDPKLLFCDEPSAGLDPAVSAQIDDLILSLRDALGMSVIVVTHELDSAFKIADRIAVLDKGEMIMVGSVQEVRTCDNQRVQNLLNRRIEEDILDPDQYLERLTGVAVDTTADTSQRL